MIEFKCGFRWLAIIIWRSFHVAGAQVEIVRWHCGTGWPHHCIPITSAFCETMTLFGAPNGSWNCTAAGRQPSFHPAYIVPAAEQHQRAKENRSMCHPYYPGKARIRYQLYRQAMAFLSLCSMSMLLCSMHSVTAPAMAAARPVTKPYTTRRW